MAHILKEGKTYKDPFNGEITSVYIVAKIMDINKKLGHIDVMFEAYNKKESRLNNSKPIKISTLRIPFNEAMLTLIDQLTEEAYKESLLQTVYEGGEELPVTIAGALATDLQSDE